MNWLPAWITPESVNPHRRFFLCFPFSLPLSWKGNWSWECRLGSASLWKVVQPAGGTTSEIFLGPHNVRKAAEDPGTKGTTQVSSGVFRRICKQGCHSHLQFRLSKCEFLSPKGNQEGEGYLWSSSQQAAATPYGEHKENQRILAPDSWGAAERDDFGEPRHLHLPIHREALNSLIWDTWFSLIHKNIFDIQTTFPLLQISIQSDTPTPPSQFPLGYLTCYLSGLKS